ncbi:MAG: AMP-binding protein [Acidimicrobiia bacterium]
MDGLGVAAHARLRPDKVAMVHGDRRITYADLDDLAARAAVVLDGHGVSASSRLGIALANRPEWFVGALGAARLGAQCVPIPAGATADERVYFCTDGDVGFLLDADVLAEFTRAVAEVTAEELAAAPERAPDYVSLRAYTSGTTGLPKAVLRPEAPAQQSADGLVNHYVNYGLESPDEVNVTASPFHHLAGFSGPHSAFLLGHTTVILDHFDAAEWFAAVRAERVTYAWCAPVHLYRMMTAPDGVKVDADVSSVKRLLHGSAPCAPSLKREVMDFFPPNTVWETYGGTETMGTVITAEEWVRKPGSVGRAAPNSTIAIFDDDGHELGAGEVGLVYIGSDWGRGFRYAGDASLTESIYRGDLATLGDLGYLDEDGYLFVVDRRKDMIITGGANVYPAEVEAVLVAHPHVAEVAVIGVPDAEYGELVCAVVVTAGDLSQADVIDFAREHLVRYKAPRRVEFVAELPRDPMGKVRKRELRGQLS